MRITYFSVFSDGCTIDAIQFNDEKSRNADKETEISLVLQNSYGTDMVSGIHNKYLRR